MVTAYLSSANSTSNGWLIAHFWLRVDGDEGRFELPTPAVDEFGSVYGLVNKDYQISHAIDGDLVYSVMRSKRSFR